MGAFLTVLGIAAFMLVICLLVALIVFNMAFLSGKRNNTDIYYGLVGEGISENKKRSRALIDELLKYGYEDVYIKSFDNKSLHGRYYHVKNGAPVQIQFHGYRSMAQRDFAGGALECIRRGHNLLLVDQRAHGESEGRVITFGILERFDCLSWVEFASLRFGKDVPILLFGISMGAATVLMASELRLPENLCAIVADCPYSSPIEIICKVSRDMGIPEFISRLFIRLGARLYGGFDVSAASAAEAVKNTEIPILLIHGEADDFVPCDMSRRIAENNANIKFVSFPEARHGTSYLVDTERYMRIINEFVDGVLLK